MTVNEGAVVTPIDADSQLHGRVRAAIAEMLYRYWRLEGGARNDCGYRSGKADGIDTAVSLLREMAGVTADGLDVPAQRRANGEPPPRHPAWLPDEVDDHVDCVVTRSSEEQL